MGEKTRVCDPVVNMKVHNLDKQFGFKLTYACYAKDKEHAIEVFLDEGPDLHEQVGYDMKELSDKEIKEYGLID